MVEGLDMGTATRENTIDKIVTIKRRTVGAGRLDGPIKEIDAMKFALTTLNFISPSLIGGSALAMPNIIQISVPGVQVTSIPDLSAWKGQPLFNHRQFGADAKISRPGIEMADLNLLVENPSSKYAHRFGPKQNACASGRTTC